MSRIAYFLFCCWLVPTLAAFVLNANLGVLLGVVVSSYEAAWWKAAFSAAFGVLMPVTYYVEKARDDLRARLEPRQ